MSGGIYGVARRVFGLAVIATAFGATTTMARSASGEITLSGVVPELRSIVVDDHDEIIQLTSNTPHAVMPSITRDTTTGPSTVMTAGIRLQYSQLIARLDMTRPGIWQTQSLRAGSELDAILPSYRQALQRVASRSMNPGPDAALASRSR